MNPHPSIILDNELINLVVYHNINVSSIDNHKPMVEEDNEKGWSFPVGRNALYGASLVFGGIGFIIYGLVTKAAYWDDSGSTLFMISIFLLGIAFILYGSVLVVRYDDHGNRRVPGQEDATGEDPPGYSVREPDQGNVHRFIPVHPDPLATPLGQQPIHSSPPTYGYPPVPTGRPEPGRCVECGGKLFLGRENCPHCGTPISHLDLNDS